MSTKKKEPKRERRIQDEIVVDAYGPEEQAMGWYYYLDEHLVFPFHAQCMVERAISPLKKKETVEVISMAPEAECQHEMFVTIKWEGRTFAVPLSQLKVNSKAEAETKEAVGDWHYWVGQGYEL